VGRLSLYEIHNRKGTLYPLIATLRAKFGINPTSKQAMEVLECSASSAEKFLEDVKLLQEVPIADLTKSQIVKSVRETHEAAPTGPQWGVCAGPLRGTYTRPTSEGESEEYFGVTLFLGIVHATTEKEAIERLKQKANGNDSKLLGVLNDATLFAWRIIT
jgi:hypothetical protein